MSQRYIWIRSARGGKGDFIEVERLMGRPRKADGVQIMRDLPAYKSPLGDGVIEGRAARREHFKRTRTREVDPSEFKPVLRNAERAKRFGYEVTGDPLPKPTRWNTRIDANWKEG